MLLSVIAVVGVGLVKIAGIRLDEVNYTFHRRALALGIRTALASGCADDQGHVGRCRVFSATP